MPIFEHGSISDRSTYDFLSRQLALKALASVSDILNDNPELGLFYVCAVDDSACKGLSFSEANERGILEYMKELPKRFKDTLLEDQSGRKLPSQLIEEGRLCLETHQQKYNDILVKDIVGITACDLPEIIKKFLDVNQ
ncbi:MAG: hypothetical protein ABL903_17330 [Methylococcales bacterium]